MNKTVLLVEDDVQIRTILSSLFKKKEWKVIEAHEGYEGVEMYEKHKPEFILTDLNMPFKLNGEDGLNGIEMIEEIKKRHKGNNFPKIFVLSGNIDLTEKVNQIDIVSSCFEKTDMVKAVEKITFKVNE